MHSSSREPRRRATMSASAFSEGSGSRRVGVLQPVLLSLSLSSMLTNASSLFSVGYHLPLVRVGVPRSRHTLPRQPWSSANSLTAVVSIARF